MPTRSRKRRTFDMGRLREALRGPGADTRVWIATARVDDDPDAVVWDDQIGWLVDVTFYGGPLDQEGPVPCRLGGAFSQEGGTKSDPPGAGCEVLVAITDGNPNSNPVIVARLHNTGCNVPTEVNGDPIDEAKAKATHIVVTPHSTDQEYGGTLRISATQMAFLADLVELTQEGATQSFVRGDDFKITYDGHGHSSPFGPTGGTIIPLPASNLSTKIKGE